MPTPMDESATNFKLDTSDYLGIKYAAFKDDMLALALANPSTYFLIRKSILEKVKQAAVEQQFNIYYNLLSTGTDPTGQKNLLADSEHAKIFVPCYPAQLTSQFALGAAKTIDKIEQKKQ